MADNIPLSPKDLGGLDVIGAGSITRPVDAHADLVRAAELAEHADAPATKRAYEADVRDWERYADAAGLAAFPIEPAALAAYLGHLDGLGRKVSTIRRRCSALARLHRERDVESPTEDPRVRKVLRGLTRTRGTAPKRKRAIGPAALRAVLLDPCTSQRDRAVLAVGFCSGLRRAELAALAWVDVEEHEAGLVVHVRRSKTDQAGAGDVVAVPYGPDPATCPVRLLAAWRAVAEGDSLFDCSPQTIARIVQRAAERAGLDPEDFGGHSLRAGLATVAAEAGVSLGESMAATRHRSASVAATYVRPAAALANRAHRAAAEALGDRRT